VILQSPEPERLYTGLSLLVCAASDGEPARGLATFGALTALLAPGEPTHVIAEEVPAFNATLAALRETAAELPDCRLWACAAALQAAGATVAPPLEGVLSIPAFLRETAGARLVVV